MGDLQSLIGKSSRVQIAVSELRRRFGAKAFSLVDYWPDNPEIIGIARPDDEEPCLTILTANKGEGQFDVEHNGIVFQDCVVEGLIWLANEELRDKERPRDKNRDRRR